ncbi:lipopolysaccharide biosynthesis protein [Georgenia sp. EYE_87]|uniref:lipopolysaccharide biosynthesis protein n=1 Tax=Georgenia sp. EYE_87 TaxID=2853448 RepID=UPI002004D92C|nr:lipopolysaccharide biosynthesis protein [Georgenia sp. EYE_87]MCK6209401.1 lipopolysaccharide biosynthesis protein [Georgenia sp. EYE_87]
MGSGFVFWIVAANITSAQEVGLTAAMVSGVTLCTQFALLGVGAAFIRSFPEFAAAPKALLDSAITMVALAAVVAGALFLGLNGTLSTNMAAAMTDGTAATLFLVMAVLGTLGALLDQVSMALGRGRQVLARNVAGSLVTITAAFVLGSARTEVPAADLFLCWVLGGAAAALIGVWQLRRSLRYTYRPRPARALVRLLARRGVPNHALTLSERVPPLLLPILVTEFLSPTSTAHWYAVWMMAWAVYVMPISVGIATFAEAARVPATISRTLRSSLRWSLKLGTLGAVGLALAAVPALSLLGPDYAQQGAWPLRILVVGVLPVTIVQTYFSLSRAAGRIREALVLGVLSACAAVTATTAAGLSHGLLGMAVAWVLVQAATAAWAGVRIAGMVRRIAGQTSATAGEPDPVVTPTLAQTAASALGKGGADAAVAAPAGTALARSPRSAPPDPGPIIHQRQLVADDGPPAGLAVLEPGSARGPVRTGTARHARAAPPGRATPRRNALLVGVALGILLAGSVLAVTAAASIDMADATDTGIVELLPATYWIGIAGMCVLFGTLLAVRSAPDWLLGVCVVGLVVVLFGVPVVASELPRLNVSFRHAGIVENLARTGTPDPSLDAYFSWPGFFMLGALLSEIAGFEKPLSLAHLAPLYTNLLYLPPLILLMRALTSDRRRQWLAIWVFYLAQWPNQDYFAPQSYTYLLYLTCLAVVLRWYSGPHTGPSGNLFRRQPAAPQPLLDTPVGPSLPDRTRALLFAVLAVLVLATVPSHQLTPYAVLVALAVLTLAHGRSVRTLTAVTAVAALAWLLFAATAYTSGHLPSLLGDAGDIGMATNANLLERIEGTPGHLLVVRVRLAFSAVVGALAVVGTLRRLRHGRWDRTAVMLGAAAYLLLPMQPYGGEMLLRCYLFSLPFMAFLAAAALLPTPARLPGRWWAVPVAVVVITGLLAPGLIVSRYGNARIDQFTKGEAALVSAMYAGADPGAYLFALANNVPWKDQEYEQHEYRIVDNMGTDPGDPAELATHMTELAESSRGGGWFVVTRSQRAYTEFYGGLDRATEEQLTDELENRHGWRLVASSSDGALFAKEARP